MDETRERRRERAKSLLIVLLLVAIAVFAFPVGIYLRDLFHLPTCCGAGMEETSKPPGLEHEREVF